MACCMNTVEYCKLIKVFVSTAEESVVGMCAFVSERGREESCGLFVSCDQLQCRLLRIPLCYLPYMIGLCG